ncbi:MAG: hypothetical protein JXL67_05880 [Calditrichaeota bacterium]|nr:hypothetical protein [Calditrichota bacterium]
MIVLKGIVRISWYFLMVLIFPLSVTAQPTNFTFDHISMEEGLSQSTILAITQDENGFLWIGTQEGLNRYDGYNFVIYKFDPYHQNSISDNWITSLLLDRENNLWIGTNAGGLNLFDRSKNSFIHFRHNANNKHSLRDDRVLSLMEDKEGSIWIGTVGGGLHRLYKDKMRIERYDFDKKFDLELNQKDVTAILEDTSGNLWWGTNGSGLFRLNMESNILKNFIFNPQDNSTISGNNISVIFQDNNGNIWIGTNGQGLNKYIPETESFFHYKHQRDNSFSISNNFIHTIFEDNQEYLWIGTDDGLNQFLQSKEQFYSVKSDPANPTSLTNNMIRSIYQDRGGIIWIGTYSGALNKFDNKKAVFRNFRQNPANPHSLSDKNVWSVCEDDRGFVWVGTNNGMNKLNLAKNRFSHYFHDSSHKNSLGHNLVRSIYQDKKGNLWIGTEGGGLNLYDYKNDNFKSYKHDPNDSTTISDNNLRHIFEDNDGNLWIGTINGLNKFDRNNKTFRHYYHDPNNPNTLSGNHIRYIYQDRRGAIWVGTFGGLSLYISKEDHFISFYNNPANPASLSNDRVLCIHEDQKGRLWIGTYGGGLDLLDTDEFIFSHYSSANGLPNDAIYGILEDSRGNLWLSTNQGLSKFNPDSMTFKNYDVNDGLQSNEFNGNAFYQNNKGEMFFGGINGFTVFLPEKVKKNNYIPPIVITSLKKYDEEIKIEKGINDIDHVEISYKDNFLSFEFAALDFTNPAKNKYSYQLLGFDKTWINSGTRRYASYTNLDGGTYIFKVRGSNNDGLWNNEGTSLKLIIHPPFWQTWWFKLLLIIFIMTAIYVIITLRIRSVTTQKRKLELEVAQRTRELNQSNYELLRAKRDTDDILNNVNEGLFLLNKEYDIGSQYSRALEGMLNEVSLSNTNFLSLLQQKLPSENVNSTREFLQLMFKEDVDEETLCDLNPLQEIEINFTDGNGSWTHSKFLSFYFRRIYEDGVIQNLIITVNDITEQKILEEKLRLSEERTQNQMEWLVNILHIEPTLLNEFLEGVEVELGHIDSMLMNSGDNGNFEHLLEEIYRSMHLIKGNAALLDLKFFADMAHEFEEKLNEVKRMSEIGGKDFVPLVMNLSKIRQHLNEIKKLIDRISNFHSHFSLKRDLEGDILLKSIKNLINNLSKDLNKEVEFNYSNFQTTSLPYRYRLLVKEILIQLVRNALFHGIESPEDRIRMKKRSPACLSLASNMGDNEYKIFFRDDGRGIQMDELILSAKTHSKFSKDDVEKWERNSLARLIFEPGFTTAKNVNTIAGRGVGLDLIKKKLDNINGKIEVIFEEGQYCEFIVTIPIDGKQSIRASRKKRQQKV